MVDFPSNPLAGDKHYEEGQVWTFIDPPGVWVVGEGTSGTVKIAESGTDYQIWGDTLIQWGYDATDGTGNVGVSFQKAFRDASYRFVAMPLFQGGLGDDRGVQWQGAVETGISVVGTVDGVFGVVGFNWIAVGPVPDAEALPSDVGTSLFADMYLNKETNEIQTVNATTEFLDDTWTYNSAFLQRYAPDDNWTGLGWSNNAGFTYFYLGLDPSDNNLVMERYDGGGNFLGTAYEIINATGVVNFTNNIGVGGDVYFERVQSKNESGAFWRRDNGNGAAYLFWDEAGSQLRLNMYDSAGAYTGTPLSIGTSANDSIVMTRSLLLDRSSAALYVDGQNGNSHVYFRHNDVNQALIYSPLNTDTGTLHMNHYNNGGAFIGSTLFYSFQSAGRVETGDVVINKGAGRYYGPNANFGCNIQNNNGGPVSFGDLGFHRLVGGGSGPVGVYLEVANNNNVSNWGIHCDFTSDIRTKDAVQPSQIDALKEIGELLPIRWLYNDLAPRIGEFVQTEAQVKRTLERKEFDDFTPLDTAVEGEYVVSDEDQTVELGFSSEDIKRIAPGAVYTVKGVERIDYRQVVPHCLRAIQQLTERLEALENE